MENIVQPVSAASSQARAPNGAASGGKEGAGGLFGLLLSAQTANGDSPNGIGKKAAENCTDPMASLLISAMLQGSIFIQNSAPEGTSENNTQQLSTWPSATAESGASSVSALMALLAQKNPTGAGQLSDADAQLFSKLKALLTQAGGSDGLPQQLSGDSGAKLQLLLASLSSGGGAQSGETAGASQTAPQALEEIRRLFAEFVASDQKAEGAPSAAAQGTPAQASPKEFVAAQQSPPDAAAPQQAAQPQGALFQAASTAQTGDGKATDGGGDALLSGKAGDKSAAASKHIAEEKTGVPTFQAAMKAVHSQPETPATQDSNKVGEASARQTFDSIVDRITSMQSSSQKEMEISLKPDFLGKVTIKLTMDGGGSLVARISASNPKVQDAMTSQASALQSSLEAQGLKDVRVVVTSSAVPDTSLQQQADRRGQGEGYRGRRNAVVVNAADSTESASPLSAYEQAYRTGSINYLA